MYEKRILIGSSFVVCILQDRAKKASVYELLSVCAFFKSSVTYNWIKGSLFASAGLNFYRQVLHTILIKLDQSKAGSVNSSAQV